MCDFAETYHIYDIKQLPLHTVAVFCYGLKNDSRIKMKLRGDNYTMSEMILAMIYVRTALLQWYQTVNGRKGIDPPEQLTAKLIGVDNENDKDDNLLSFDNGEDFETRRKMILKGDEVNGFRAG